MSTEDGPGIRTTVFFKQCPLTCIWCHNPESISAKPQLEWLEHKCIGCKICIETCPNEALLLDDEGLHINRLKCVSCGKCVEECPSTALHMWGENWSLDYDSDTFPNILDSDSDGDGWSDEGDAYPSDSSKWKKEQSESEQDTILYISMLVIGLIIISSVYYRLKPRI